MLGSKQRVSSGEPLGIPGPKTWFGWTHSSDHRSLQHQFLSSGGTSEPQDGNMPLWSPVGDSTELLPSAWALGWGSHGSNCS